MALHIIESCLCDSKCNQKMKVQLGSGLVQVPRVIYWWIHDWTSRILAQAQGCSQNLHKNPVNPAAHVRATSSHMGSGQGPSHHL